MPKESLFYVSDEVIEAEKRIRKHIRETAVEFSPYLSQLGNCQVYLKLENMQITNSFKLRGAMNKYLSLTDIERKNKVITASSGNHGSAFAYVLKKFNGIGVIYLPENTSPAKIDALRMYGTDLIFYGNDCIKSELYAKNIAAKNRQVFISPYNDLKIIGGQGTIGIELKRQINNIDCVLVPVGGGGLISGIAGYLKPVDEKIEVFGCQPKNSPVMYESITAGKIIEMQSKPTISDGTAGGIEPGSVTFDICRELVDDFILVEEDEIKKAIRLILEKHFMLVEGGAALSVASFIKNIDRFKNKTVVLILSGSKISLNKLREIIL